MSALRATLSLGSMTDWNSAPNMAGEIFDQSNRQASNKRFSHGRASNEGIRRAPANRSPLTYGKLGEILVESRQALAHRCVEYLE